jgi:hypothetical protein
VDAIAGAAHVPVDDVYELGIQLFAHELFVAGVLQLGTNGFEEP